MEIESEPTESVHDPRVSGTLGFIRPSFSGNDSYAEIGFDPQGEFVAIRNSQDPENVVTLTPYEFKAFVSGIKAGEFDQFLTEEGGRS